MTKLNKIMRISILMFIFALGGKLFAASSIIEGKKWVVTHRVAMKDGVILEVLVDDRAPDWFKEIASKVSMDTDSDWWKKISPYKKSQCAKVPLFVNGISCGRTWNRAENKFNDNFMFSINSIMTGTRFTDYWKNEGGKSRNNFYEWNNFEEWSGMVDETVTPVQPEIYERDTSATGLSVQDGERVHVAHRYSESNGRIIEITVADTMPAWFKNIAKNAILSDWWEKNIAPDKKATKAQVRADTLYCYQNWNGSNLTGTFRVEVAVGDFNEVWKTTTSNGMYHAWAYDYFEDMEGIVDESKAAKETSNNAVVSVSTAEAKINPPATDTYHTPWGTCFSESDFQNGNYKEGYLNVPGIFVQAKKTPYGDKCKNGYYEFEYKGMKWTFYSFEEKKQSYTSYRTAGFENEDDIKTDVYRFWRLDSQGLSYGFGSCYERVCFKDGKYYSWAYASLGGVDSEKKLWIKELPGDPLETDVFRIASHPATYDMDLYDGVIGGVLKYPASWAKSTGADWTSLTKANLPKAGDKITVHIKFMSDTDIPELKVLPVDDSQGKDNIINLSETQSIKNIKAGQKVDTVLTFEVTADAKDWFILQLSYDELRHEGTPALTIEKTVSKSTIK